MRITRSRREPYVRDLFGWDLESDYEKHLKDQIAAKP